MGQFFGVLPPFRRLEVLVVVETFRDEASDTDLAEVVEEAPSPPSS
jgi:hypothetical protein